MRLRSLDSVRGIAALIVLFYHCSLAFPTESTATWLKYFPIRLLVGGPVAVVLFFVLSGLVLAGTFVERDGERFAPYAAKRVVRIYIPFAAAILLSIILKFLFDAGPVAGATPWFNIGTWDQPLSGDVLVETFAMTGRYTRLDNPSWSLIHELRISLIFPALVWITIRDWRLALGATTALAAACVKTIAAVPEASWLVAYINTAVYLPLFVMGIAVADRSKPLRAWLAPRSAVVHLILWVIALTALAYAPTNTGDITHLSELGLIMVNGIAASLVLLLAAVEGRVMAALLGPVPLFLGRISFSLYLVHMLTIAAAVHALPAAWPLAAKVATGAVLAVPTAYLFHRTVEQPSAAWSRRLGDSLSHHLKQAIRA